MTPCRSREPPSRGAAIAGDASTARSEKSNRVFRMYPSVIAEGCPVAHSAPGGNDFFTGGRTCSPDRGRLRTMKPKASKPPRDVITNAHRVFGELIERSEQPPQREPQKSRAASGKEERRDQVARDGPDSLRAACCTACHGHLPWNPGHGLLSSLAGSLRSGTTSGSRACRLNALSKRSSNCSWLSEIRMSIVTLRICSSR
jgi:hypothetical protein